MRAHSPAPIETLPLQADEIDEPEPGPHEVLVRVRASAVCRTDLHVIEGDLPFPPRPITPGHQIVGIVEQVGSAVGSVARGARVGIAWLRRVCGSCPYCARGQDNLCAQPRFTGYHVDGGYAELAVVPEDFAYPIPKSFGDVDAAPLLCAGIVGYRALKRAEVPPSGRLVMFGFGSSAHVTLQVAVHLGYEVLVKTRHPAHQQLARDLGAVWAGSLEDHLPTLADSAIVFAPDGRLVPLALDSIDRGGTVALAGIVMSGVPKLEYERHLFHEKNLRSVESNTREDGRELLALAAKIPIRPHTEVFPLQAANQVLLALKKSELKGTGVLIP